MSNSLVSIQAKAMELELEAIKNDGLLSPELEEALDLTKGELASKIDGYKTYIDYLAFRAGYFDSIVKEATKYKKTLENLVVSLEGRIDYAMGLAQTDELKGHQYRFKKQRSKDKLIIDMSKLPEEYTEEKSETVPLKDHIRSSLDAGKEVPGAKLEPSFFIRDYLLTSKK